MPFINGGHIWLIAILLIIVLIIWGPGKLPDVGSGLGRAIHEFRKASTHTRDEFNKATRPDEPSAAAPAPAATPAPVPVVPPTVEEPTAVGAAPAPAPVAPAARPVGEGDATVSS